MPVDKMARKDAATLLVKEIDQTIRAWGRAHPEKMANPETAVIPIQFSVKKWRQIAEAFRSLAED